MEPLIIFGATYLVFIIAAVAVVGIFLHTERRLRIFYIALVALPLAYALARVAGMFYSHHQPFAELGFEPLIPHEVDNSFPSDHVVLSGAFASLAFLADRRLGLALWALALLVGLCRMLAGLHWGVDVAVAALVAAAAVWGVRLLFTMLQSRLNNS